MKTTTIRNIALRQLEIAPENARKSKVLAEDDASLVASIAVHGVKQNLIVYPGPKNTFLVTGGGRRLRALHMLAESGAIGLDYKIPCTVVDQESAVEMSLVENSVRAAMHPADEFEAFNTLIGQGASEEDVASRFGVTVLHVRKRLKLARVAPEIVAQYREGVLKLDSLMAFTLTDSHDRQREVWEQIQPHLRYGGSPDHYIRQLLTDTRAAGDSRLATLVGAERYEAAGGTITRDLFAERRNVFFDDPGLLEQLATTVLEEKAAELREEGWKWTEVMLEMPWDAARAFGRVYPEPVEADPALTAELEDIERALDGFGELEELSEEQEAENERLMDRAEELERQIGGSEQCYTAEAMAVAGCLVSVGHDGTIRVEAGLVRPEDIPAPEPAPAEAADTDGVEDGEDGEAPEAVAGPKPLRISAPLSPNGATSTTSYVDPAAARRQELGLSAALAEDLRAIRHQIMQAHLAGDFEVAFDLHLYALCQHVFIAGYRAKPIDVSVQPAFVTHAEAHLKGTVAEKMRASLKEALRLDWLKLPAPEDFKAMCALTSREKQALFAYATSHGLAQQLAVDNHAQPVIEVAGQRMGVDVAACWRPTAANYFGRVKKDLSLTIAREQIGEQWAHDHGADKKGVLAEAMEAAFSEDARERAGLAPDVAAQTGRWLPPGMGMVGLDPAAAAPDAADPASQDEDTADDEEAADAGKELGEGEEEIEIPAFLTSQAA